MRMATHPLWNDDYWLLVLQLYLKRPTGVKAVYAREAVDLAVELHLPPQFIHQQLQTPKPTASNIISALLLNKAL